METESREIELPEPTIFRIGLAGGFGPVLWRLTPENQHVFDRLNECGYHFLPVGERWQLGISLPPWFTRRKGST